MKGLPRSLANGKAGTEPAPRRVRYDLKNFAINVTGGASTAEGFGTAVLGDVPEGNILLLGGISYLQFSSSDADVIATWSGKYSVGTTATADATLSTTDIDLISNVAGSDGTAISAATAKLSPVTRGQKVGVAMLDNTDGSLELNLNMTTADNSVTDSLVGTFAVNGYVELVYIVLGDD